jgi:hypothetical protein
VSEPSTHLGSGFTASHPISIFDGDAMFRDFMREIAVQLDRIQSWAMPVKAIALREDLWPEDLMPGLNSAFGYPVVRLAASSPVRWGVIT